MRNCPQSKNIETRAEWSSIAYKKKEISRLVLVLRSLRRRRDEGRAGRRSPSGEQSSGGEGILEQQPGS
uniref:Uncharacterized protein n=1 Tax=Oryza glumipatula TaxID=40148 RepID=A0A0E0A7S6_9ORYZ